MNKAILRIRFLSSIFSVVRIVYCKLLRLVRQTKNEMKSHDHFRWQKKKKTENKMNRRACYRANMKEQYANFNYVH